jgi:hypothetical protein
MIILLLQKVILPIIMMVWGFMVFKTCPKTPSNAQWITGIAYEAKKYLLSSVLFSTGMILLMEGILVFYSKTR